MSDAVDQAEFVLPPSIVTKHDLARLIDEMERIDSELTTRDAHIKANIPVTSEITFTDQMTDFLAVNNLEIGDTAERADLLKRMRRFKMSSPVIHMTFASSADTESLRQLVVWLRQSVHSQSVVAVGLQPSLIGGVYIRTPNQVHDFSMRAKLAGHRDIIIREVEALSGGN